MAKMPENKDLCPNFHFSLAKNDVSLNNFKYKPIRYFFSVRMILLVQTFPATLDSSTAKSTLAVVDEKRK